MKDFTTFILFILLIVVMVVILKDDKHTKATMLKIQQDIVEMRTQIDKHREAILELHGEDVYINEVANKQ
jgi:hypothetical protein